MKYIILCTVLLYACGEPASLSREVILSDTTKDASCAYITRTTAGTLAVSWLEGNPATLCYAVSSDEGATFPEVKRIPTATGIPPHAENLPKMAFLPGGQIIALYGLESNDPRNKYAGKVYYTRSLDNGEHWQPATPLVTDTTGYDQRYFDIAVLPSGEAAAIWLDNRKQHTKEGSTLYIAFAGKDGFTQERAIAQTVCQCCRTDLYMDAEGAIHAAFRDIINDTIRDMVHILSADNGRSFTKPVRISADNWAINGCPHTGPTMVKNAGGLHFAWFTMGGGQGVFYCRSEDNGATYTKRESVSALPVAKHPQLAALKDGSIVLVWDEAKDASTSRIGIQYREADGRAVSTGFITPEGTFANYPVIREAAPGKALVAYKKRKGNREMVCVQLVGR